MRRLAVVAAVLGATFVAAFASQAAGPPSVTIHAEFFSASRLTEYTLIVTNEPIGDIPVVFWTLTLMKIDDNGSVDATCTRTSDGPTQRVFIWHHPDGECDHAKEGTHGHQGRISVKAHYKDWDCEATYDGTTGTPPEGLTVPCTGLTPPSSATGPCDDERARLAQIEAEIGAAKSTIKALSIDYYAAYYTKLRAEYRYYDVEYKAGHGSSQAWAAWEEWYKAYADLTRIVKTRDELRVRIRILERERAKARAALAACEDALKKFAPSGPAARCSVAMLTAARARGRAAGYAEVARRFGAATFTRAAARLRSAAIKMRAAAQHAPGERSRLLADAKRTQAAAAKLARSAAELATVKRRQITAAKSAALAYAALSRCRSAG